MRTGDAIQALDYAPGARGFSIAPGKSPSTIQPQKFGDRHRFTLFEVATSELSKGNSVAVTDFPPLFMREIALQIRRRSLFTIAT